MSVARLPYVAVACAAALAVVVTGCSMSPEPWAPAPLSHEDRLAIYERSLDERWSWVTSQYPDAVRPDVPDPVEVTQSGWSETMGACLRDIGYVVTENNGGYTAQPSPGVDLQSLAIGDYYCNARYPWEGTLDGLLSPEELNALYTYYVEILTPCLALSGREVRDIPTRDAFVRNSLSWVSWHPFWSTGADASYSEADLRMTNARCRLEPSWHSGILTGS